MFVVGTHDTGPGGCALLHQHCLPTSHRESITKLTCAGMMYMHTLQPVSTPLAGTRDHINSMRRGIFDLPLAHKQVCTEYTLGEAEFYRRSDPLSSAYLLMLSHAQLVTQIHNTTPFTQPPTIKTTPRFRGRLC